MTKEQPHNLIDETIHQRTRLAIMATLASISSLEFNELKARLALTDGNLSAHLSALERAGYVRIIKRFRGQVPRTKVSQTAKGRTAMERYVASPRADALTALSSIGGFVASKVKTRISKSRMYSSSNSPLRPAPSKPSRIWPSSARPERVAYARSWNGSCAT